MRVNLRQISEAAAHDPKAPLLKAVGNLDEIEVFHNLVLAATYIAPPKMMKGPNGEDVPFYSTDKALTEDRFQGKVFLVLQVGPTAFQDASGVAFGGKTVKPGDWIMARPSDGMELFKGDGKDGTTVRLFEDVHIKGRVTDPSVIY